MTFYELTLILDDDQQEHLEKLAERYKKFNNWTEKDLLQFSINAVNCVEIMLKFMEAKIAELEQNQLNF